MYRRVAFAASYPELQDIAEHYEFSVKSMTLLHSQYDVKYLTQNEKTIVDSLEPETER